MKKTFKGFRDPSFVIGISGSRSVLFEDVIVKVRKSGLTSFTSTRDYGGCSDGDDFRISVRKGRNGSEISVH